MATFLLNPMTMLPAQGYPQTAQTPAQQSFQKPAFQGKVAVFPAEPGRKYQYSGNVTFPAAELPALIQYLQTKQPDEYGNIRLRLIGFNNQSRAGQQYIGGFVSPMQEQQPMQQAQPVAYSQPVRAQANQQPPTTQQPPVWSEPGAGTGQQPPF